MQEKNFEISLGQLIKIALKRWWIIVLAVLVCSGAMFAYAKFFSTPTYTSRAKVGVSSSEMTSYQDAIMGQTLATECSDILEGSITLKTAVEFINSKYDRSYTLADLERMVSTSTSNDTRYFYVTVTTTANDVTIDDTGMTKNEAEAARNLAAREEAKIVCEEVIAAFEHTFAHNAIIEGAKVHTVDDPKLGAESSSTLTKSIIIGALVGFALSMGGIVIAGFFKDAIESEDWLATTFGDSMPVLAVIPDATDAKSAYSKYSKKYGYHTGRK